ncbi:DUF2188 domain-containing protein [Mesorhizobium sp. ESP6-5]|uniref:DUF2188 domain-containing protein n=1 Tax=Mesorhizobium sp. ESP6-5 TaxID=2876623 RepID=UPI001CCA32E8|nr:DUF2188 domain-containing protein [Mesorhizobium sp. ESP6-5]MBZ9756893.1 DUF2188 domain-containing protein [Mesorhizobium sp. ESP6-5]
MNIVISKRSSGAGRGHVRYFISKIGDQWLVRFDGKDYPYAAHSEAVRAAVKAASSASATGYGAEVLVQGVDGKWRTEWPID